MSKKDMTKGRVQNIEVIKDPKITIEVVLLCAVTILVGNGCFQ